MKNEIPSQASSLVLSLSTLNSESPIPVQNNADRSAVLAWTTTAKPGLSNTTLDYLPHPRIRRKICPHSAI